MFLYATPGESHYLADTTARVVGSAVRQHLPKSRRTAHPQPPAYQSAVAPPLGPGGATYYDDNAWGGLDLIHAYLATGNATDLTLAQNEFNFAITGWDASTTDGCPAAGLLEDVAGSQRNTTANGANAELGAELICSPQRDRPSWATRMYQWAVRLPRTRRLYDDHVSPNGSVNSTIWSYNPGRHGRRRRAGWRKRPARARTSHRRSRRPTRRWRTSDRVGPPDPGPAFNAIYFRDLFLLNQVRRMPLRRRCAELRHDDVVAAPTLRIDRPAVRGQRHGADGRDRGAARGSAPTP